MECEVGDKRGREKQKKRSRNREPETVAQSVSDSCVFPDLDLYNNHCSYSDKTDFSVFSFCGTAEPAAFSDPTVSCKQLLHGGPSVLALASGGSDKVLASGRFEKTIKLWDISAAGQRDK
jgi:hypothetical protein